MTDEDLLPLADAARLGGTNATKVRRLVKEGRLPYRLQDLATGELVPDGDTAPARFQYLVPRRAVQAIADLAGRVPGPSGNPDSGSVSTTDSPVRSHGTTPLPSLHSEVIGWRLRAEVAEAKLQARGEVESVLRAYIAQLEGQVQDLKRLLPPAPSDLAQGPATEAQQTLQKSNPYLREVVVPDKPLTWWQRLFRRA